MKRLSYPEGNGQTAPFFRDALPKSYKLYFIIIECGRELVNEAAAGGHAGRGTRSARKKPGFIFENL